MYARSGERAFVAAAVEEGHRAGGLLPFDGRIFSGHEMPRSKPAPDVYLAAMAALGVRDYRCAVIEDTVTGAMAGIAAGATVFGYSPPEAGRRRTAPNCVPPARPSSSRTWRDCPVSWGRQVRQGESAFFLHTPSSAACDIMIESPSTLIRPLQ